jgi:hypothetical protein
VSNTEERAIQNQRSLDRLAKTIALSQGRFSLVLACGESPELPRAIVAGLRKISPIEIDEIWLSPTSQTLYSSIISQLHEQQPQALMVYGLDTVIELDRLWKSANLVRNQFAQHCPYPICLWMGDETLQKLRLFAPDLRNWAANPLRFYDP